MKLLLVHQNMPGQYRELIDWLVGENARLRAAGQTPHEVVFLTQRKNMPAPDGITKLLYAPHRRPAKDAYGLSKVWEEATGAAFGAVEALKRHEAETGFRPDLAVGHTGWGEMLFLKQLWPDVPVLGFFEYFYRLTGAMVGFDPDEPVTAHTPYLLEARNAVPYANLHVADRLTAPTRWQADLFPEVFRDRMYVCHDGIRTDRLGPDAGVSLDLGRAGRITRDDEIFTYVARNMERARGFHVFMRALPTILRERPNARVLIVGGSEVSYGKSSEHEGGFRAQMEAEVGRDVDWDRVHFLGALPYADFCRVVQISRCHIYLTMPFVLSWSLLESMAMEATIVASDVAPVREAITHGKTGLLVDFHDPAALAAQVVEVLADPARFAALGPAARAHVVATYDFHDVCLPRHLAEMNALVPPEAGHFAT